MCAATLQTNVRLRDSWSGTWFYSPHNKCLRALLGWGDYNRTCRQLQLTKMVQVSTIKSMQRYESVFEYLHVAFVTNLTIYRNSLEELLSPLQLSDTQLCRLLEESDHVAWNDPELIASLRDRLGTSYLPFKSSIKQLHKKVKLFAHKLHLGANLKVNIFCPLLGLSKSR
jgi:hypothetical protein